MTRDDRLRRLRGLVRGVVDGVGSWWPSSRGALDERAQTLATLQRQAQLDSASGLPKRNQFLAQLGARLAEPGGPGVVLLLVRARCSWDVADEVGLALAEVLATYAERVGGAHAARLDVTDFALCLPVAGLAEETAASLHAALLASPVLRHAGVVVAVGGAEGLVNHDTADAMAMAGAALAEAAQRGQPVVLGQAALDSVRSGQWRTQFEQALAAGRTRLAAHRVIDAQGQTLHVDCPLRVQLEPGGAFHAAGHWLALARRSRLLPKVDLCATTLALAAIESDGQARAVHASPASLDTPGFIGQVVQRLQASPRAARKLSIEVVDAAGEPLIAAPALAEAGAAWRACGARLGLEHSQAPASMLLSLPARGVRYLKLGARHHRGLAGDPALRAYAEALVGLLRGLGVLAIAEGVDDEDDLQALWALGFDGATGPAVRD